MGLDGVPKRLPWQDAIAILSANTFTLDIAFFLENVNDALYRAFGDTHGHRDLSQHDFRIGVQYRQHVGVIGKKCPAMPGLAILCRN